MSPPKRPHGVIKDILRRYWSEWMLLVFALLVLGGVIAHSLYQERMRIQMHERDRLQVQAQVIDENLGRQLQSVSNALAGVRVDFPMPEIANTWPAASRRLKALSEAMPGVRAMGIFDADGTTVASSRIDLIGATVARTRDFFKTPKAHPDPNLLYVSQPFKSILGVYSINVVRAVTGERGEFKGIVAATLEPEYFDVVLKSVLYAPDMTTHLTHGDGKAFLFVPENVEALGMDMSRPGSPYTVHRGSGRKATVMTGVSKAMGDERMMAQRDVSRADLQMDKPLVIAVSRNLSAIYAPWRRNALIQGWVYGLFSLMAILGLYFAQLRRRMLDRIEADHQARMQEGNERLALALGGADLGLWDLKIVSRSLILDERGCAMIGYTPEEIGSDLRAWKDRVHVDDRPAVRAALVAHLKGNSPSYQAEYRVRHKDGRWIWILDRGKVVERDPSGNAVRAVGTHMDITERKRAQEALRESEQRYHALFADNSVAMLLIDSEDGRFVDANPAACAYYGWDLPTLRTMCIKDINTLSPNQVHAEMERARSRRERQFHFRHRLASGEIRDVDVFSGPVEIEGRGLLLSSVQDVTERNKAQEELKRSVAFRELLLEAMPLPIFYKDKSGRYTGCNSAFGRFVGLDPKDILGKTVFEVAPGNFARNYHDKDLDLLRDPSGLQTYESQVMHADGTPHDVIFHKARMVDDAGEPTGILGVITDITEIRRIEVTRDQLEAQLRESQKMEALGTLAGGVAHDFNNILAAIAGNVELACQDVGPDHPAMESLEEIRRASRRATALVQQILAFGRRQVTDRNVMALEPIIEESARLLRATLPAGITLNAECAPDTPPVLADATQIQQVVLNLCTNAWQALEAYEPQAGCPQSRTIQVRLGAHIDSPMADLKFGEHTVPARRYTILTVTDNGPGMNEATVARIFEPFFTTKPAGKGTGLGLSVVHGIVQEHGATIEVRSQPGAGSTFRIAFPAAEPVSSDTVAKSEGTIGEGIAKLSTGRGRHILFVDDDEAIVFLMTRLLQRRGFRVSGFTDPDEALASVRAEPYEYDLTVTDYNMPVMSGIDLARTLREIRADLPVVLASGYITEELRSNAPAAGVSEVIYKPNSVDDLCETVARLALGHAMQRGQA